MTHRFFTPACRALLGLLSVALLGCAVSSPPARFYVITPVASPEKGRGVPAPPPCVSLGIARVKVPQYLDRLGIVTRTAPNELRIGEFSKWAEPLEVSIPRTLAENLSLLLCTKTVLVFPWKSGVPMDYRVYVDITRLDGRLGGDAILEASWFVFDGTDTKKLLSTGKSSHGEPTGDESYEAFVAAQSRLIGALSRDMAEAIRSLRK